jgi:hypothetical protein
MLRCATRLSRRRAVARVIVLAAGMAVMIGAPLTSVAAPEVDGGPPAGPPGGPGDAPPVMLPDAALDAAPVTLGQDSDDTQPADEPPPVATGPLGVPPVKLTIPSLGVEAVVEAVGQDPDGAMSTPSDPDDVAWYRLGPGMGVLGNVVVAAHVNWDGRLRAFGELHLLEVGDVVQVIDAAGHGYEYVVESSHWVRAEGAPLEEIFAQPPATMMTLITCGGEYVASRREYLDRLIVRARGA